MSELVGAAMLALGFVPLCAAAAPGRRLASGALVLQAALPALAALWRGLLAGEPAALLGGVLLAARAAALWAGLRRLGAVPVRAAGPVRAGRPGPGLALAGLALVALAAVLLRPAALPPGLRELAALSLSVALLGLLAATRPGAQAAAGGLAGLGSGVLLAAAGLVPALLPWLCVAVAALELAPLAGLAALRGPRTLPPALTLPDPIEPDLDAPGLPTEAPS